MISTLFTQWDKAVFSFGPLGDRYGKRQVISLAMLLFTVATALCAAAFSITNLALYRALTGTFAASVMPVSLALIGDIFPLNRQPFPINILWYNIIIAGDV
ncbi:MAG: MFS transporter [Bacillota bacterium]